MNFTDADKLIAKDLSSASLLRQWVENVQLRGSYSDRRPDVGKMHKCAFCGRRHRMIGPRCSNADYATTQRAWSEEKGFHQVECAPRVAEQLVRKIMHKRHGQTRNNALKALTIRMQNDHDLIVAAAKEMYASRPHLGLVLPDIAAIPVFAKNYFLFKEDREQKRIRGQRDVARRVNLGLVKNGSRYRANVKGVHCPEKAKQTESAVHVRVPEQGPVPNPA